MKRAKAADGSARAVRILLVNGNRNGLVARKSVLEEHGYEVHAWGSPMEALLDFPQHAFDLVVTDYRMPEMTGAEFIAHIRILQPDIPVVVVSGVVNVLGLDEKNTGANAVIPKGATEVPNLVRTVKRLLDSQSPKKPVKSQGGAKPRKRAADSSN
jgi:CheY-like chemotaxis protein